MPGSSKALVTQLKKIKLILFDVDGVLTPGDILVHPDGSESKNFDVRDGIGIRLAMAAGLRVGFLSGRFSEAVAQRAQDLSLEICVQGAKDKKTEFLQLLEKLKLGAEEVTYVGDDIVDLPVLRRVGFAVSVCDACEEARKAAHYVTKAAGGRGAAREIIEYILKAQGRWQEVARHYLED